MKNILVKAFAGVALCSISVVLGTGLSIAGLMIGSQFGDAFGPFLGLAAGGAIGLGISAGVGRVKLKDKTIMEHVLS